MLELLQNADDNTFNHTTPTLELTYRPGSLRIDCNEVGFSARNVEALCSIGESTKGSLDHSTRYIGEKGIGFKSVFKVADVVWITSREYSFKLDRREELGMIAPIWAEFPEPVKPGYTSFYLQLAKEYNEEELQRELTTFDASLLIFLRRIRIINLCVTYPSGSVWSTTLSRFDKVNEDKFIVSLSQDEFQLDYIVRKRTVNNMPIDAKRPGCTQSEIILAFPLLARDEEKELAPQKVYAFLPIRDFGFKVTSSNTYASTSANNIAVPLAI